jgi:hypothetical protein
MLRFLKKLFSRKKIKTKFQHIMEINKLIMLDKE